MKRMYVVTMPDGKRFGVPAEKIAENYANYYSEKGDDYDQCYEDMISWFDNNCYDFADWASGNMCWSDVKEFAEEIADPDEEEPDYEDGWENGEYCYSKIYENE